MKQHAAVAETTQTELRIRQYFMEVTLVARMCHHADKNVLLLKFNDLTQRKFFVNKIIIRWQTLLTCAIYQFCLTFFFASNLQQLQHILKPITSATKQINRTM